MACQLESVLTSPFGNRSVMPLRGEELAGEALDLLAEHLDHGDGLSQVALEQLLAGDEVVLVVLLEDAGACWIGQRGEGDGGGIEPASDVTETKLLAAARELQAAFVANQSETWHAPCRLAKRGSGREALRFGAGIDGETVFRRAAVHGGEEEEEA